VAQHPDNEFVLRRRQLGLEQQLVARRAGVSRPMLSRLERGDFSDSRSAREVLRVLLDLEREQAERV
jgi:predicted transcriptional regulator